MLKSSRRGRAFAWKYTLVGGLLALGSPLGLLAARAAAGVIGLRHLQHELAGSPAIYLYLTLSTIVAFMVFGAAVGHIADRFAALSRNDPLTSLANRRVLHEQLAYWLEQSRRHGIPVSLLLIDLDHLKRINDQGGHAAGDAALLRVANAIRRTLRRTDVSGRIGGDEFAIVAPFANASEGLALGKRLVEFVVSQRPGQGLDSVSVGVASVAGEPGLNPSSTIESLLAAADAALYRAKQSGRGCVRSFEDVSEDLSITSSLTQRVSLYGFTVNSGQTLVGLHDSSPTRALSDRQDSRRALP
jgi:diguanylate cyclase (GGDEF)-like protein